MKRQYLSITMDKNPKISNKKRRLKEFLKKEGWKRSKVTQYPGQSITYYFIEML